MKTYWLVLLVAVVGLIVLGGCGGHNGQVPPGPGPIIAAFVGRAVCATCHAAIHAAYGSYNGVPFIPGTIDPTHVYENFVGSAHGQDMRSKGPGNRDVITPAPGATVGCGVSCHTVGWQEAGGYTSSATHPHLEGIGCEECHGRGSEHAGAPDTTNIARVPDAQTTCWDCHVPDYKALREPVPAITDSSAILRGRNPGSVGFNHAQASFLVGVFGYNRPTLPSPHSAVANTCVWCHLNPESGSFHGTEALKPDFRACAPCHGSAGAGEALQIAFEEEINEKLIELGGATLSDPTVPNGSPTGGLINDFAVANGIDLLSNNDPDNPVVQRYKAARHNYKYVTSGCYVHNPPFARQLLEDAEALIE